MKCSYPKEMCWGRKLWEVMDIYVLGGDSFVAVYLSPILLC